MRPEDLQIKSGELAVRSYNTATPRLYSAWSFGMCNLRRIGSKTNGLSLCSATPLVLCPLIFCMASKSASSAIFFKKAVA